MQFGKFYKEFSRLGSYSESLFLLGARLATATGFAEAARMKWDAMDAVSAWFGTMGYPAPEFLAYLVSSVEVVGVILLTLGLLTRLVAVPLMVIMAVAITTVHWEHGFEAANNGFEIPLYYFIFLGILLSRGAGRYSLDHLFFKGE